jgi:hypothetical protein
MARATDRLHQERHPGDAVNEAGRGCCQPIQTFSKESPAGSAQMIGDYVRIRASAEGIPEPEMSRPLNWEVRIGRPTGDCLPPA